MFGEFTASIPEKVGATASVAVKWPSLLHFISCFTWNNNNYVSIVLYICVGSCTFCSQCIVIYKSVYMFLWFLSHFIVVYIVFPSFTWNHNNVVSNFIYFVWIFARVVDNVCDLYVFLHVFNSYYYILCSFISVFISFT